jgi:hypothetical protein
MAKKKKKAAKKGRDREVLCVASKVKAYMKRKNMNTSAEAITCLSDRIYCMLDTASERTKANGRKTLKAQDV